jgi:hypothetical protein
MILGASRLTDYILFILGIYIYFGANLDDTPILLLVLFFYF